jgi:hypothetical protein
MVKITGYDFDPNATSVTDVGWVDMRDFSDLVVAVQRTIGTSAMTLTINGSAAANGSSAAVIATKTFTAGQPDAVADLVFLEVLAEQINPYRYVSAVISVATGTDEAVVTYIQAGARFPADGLTADIIAT